MENRTELQPYSVLMSVYSGENPEFFAQSLESLYAVSYTHLDVYKRQG